MTGMPSEKKGTKLFALPLGQSRPISENLTKELIAAPQLFLNTMSERLFKFPLSDNLCATLFSVLSGISTQQVIVPTLCHIAFYLLFSCFTGISRRYDLLFSLYRFSRKILYLIHQGIEIAIF